MAKTFFSIGSVDMTRLEDIQNHDVNRNEVYQSWTDGNWTERRTFIRNRIEGTVTLGFTSEAAYSTFLSVLNSQRLPDGTHNISVYVQNVGSTVAIRAFLTPLGEAKWDTINNLQWQTISISIMEA